MVRSEENPWAGVQQVGLMIIRGRNPEKEQLELLVEKVFKKNAQTSLEEKQTALNYLPKKIEREKLFGCALLAMTATTVAGMFYFALKNDFGIICLLPEAIIFGGAACGTYLKIREYNKYLIQPAT